MHSMSLLELQGVPIPQGALALRTTQDGASLRSSRPRRGSSRCLRPPRAAPIWVWLLLGALVLPGTRSFLTEEMEELLVELHNYYRGMVTPSASAMLPLKWDPSLKLIAEGYAAKCIWNHNPELEETGENLYAGTKPMDLREALEEWFLEHLNYDFNNNSCDEDKMCGHYTQMVWADTHRVGCALHVCSDMEGLNWGKTYFLVCNYYPAGNYEDQRPYVEGDFCSSCPEIFQKCENNLCVSEMEEEEDDIDAGDDGEFTVDILHGELIPATTAPFLLPEAETEEVKPEEEEIHDDVEMREEEAVVPPPVTSDPQIPTDTIATTSTTSTPSITTISAGDLEEIDPENTPEAGTHPPKAPPTTIETFEEVPKEVEEKAEEVVEEEVEVIQLAEEAQRDSIGKIFHPNPVTMSAASVCSPSILLAFLTAILTLRL